MQQLVARYFQHHLQAVSDSLTQLSRLPFTSLMTCFIIGITLAFPSVFLVLLKNAESVMSPFKKTMQVTLYLKKEMTESQVFSLVTLLKKNNLISEVRAISPAEGLKELKQLKEGDISSLAEALPDNPLPWTIVVMPTINNTIFPIETFTDHLKQIPGVDSLQIDKIWIKRLEACLALMHRIVVVLAIFLGVAVLLIINAMIYAVTQHHQKEIKIIQSMGGTTRFIRRPFLYAGMIYGFLGGVVAWQLIDFFMLFLKEPIYQLSLAYHSPFQLIGISLLNALCLLCVSIGLGWMGAWLAVARHVRMR